MGGWTCIPPCVERRWPVRVKGRTVMKWSIHVARKQWQYRCISQSWKPLVSLRTVYKTKRQEMHMALVLLALIILPSGLLGYFSWRALGHEQLLAQERLRESYRQFALLAAREIDDTLNKAEKGWVAAIQEFFPPDMQHPAEDFAALIRQEPLIAASFFLTAPGKVAYPPALSIQEDMSRWRPGRKMRISTSMIFLPSWWRRARNSNTAPTIWTVPWPVTVRYCQRSPIRSSVVQRQAILAGYS